MNCEELRDLIDNSLPGERSPTTLAEAHRHAGTCPTCAAALGEMLQLEQRLMRLSGIEEDQQLVHEVMSRIAALSTASAVNRAHRDWFAVGLMVAGAVILAAVYCCTTSWSDISRNFLDTSMSWSWAVFASKVAGLELVILLPALIGAALIGLGLTHEIAKPAIVPAQGAFRS
jgi:predicted anti-sigma-YlaC factor YlaD